MRDIAKRHKIIIEHLDRDGYVRVQDLSRILGVSEVTVRKDLKELEKRKVLYRSHGSASSVSFTSERHIDEKEKINTVEKLRIAKEAAAHIKENEKIVIASGTTLLAFASELPRDKNITVITSSVKVSLSLCYRSNIEVVQLGGTMRKSSVSVIGPYAEDILNGIICNRLFLGVDGIDLDYGLTTSDMGESRLNQKMIESCQKVTVLTDSSKFGKRGFSKICDFASIDQIITDRNTPANIVEALRDRGIEVILV